MSKRKKKQRQRQGVSRNPAKQSVDGAAAKAIPPAAIETETHRGWSYFEDFHTRQSFVRVERPNGSRQIYKGSQARIFRLRSQGMNFEEANGADALNAIQTFHGYLREGDLAVASSSLRSGPFVACKCGCDGTYPLSWIGELVPFVEAMVNDGNLNQLARFTQAGYAPAGELMAPDCVFMAEDEASGYYAFRGDTLCEAGRLWDKDSMNVFADHVVDASVAAHAQLINSGRVPDPGW